MPTVLRWKGYRFLFYSREVGEPPHVHVLKDRKQLEIWLRDLEVARNVGFARHEVSAIVRIVEREREQFLEAWHDYFGN